MPGGSGVTRVLAIVAQLAVAFVATLVVLVVLPTREASNLENMFIEAAEVRNANTD